MQKYLDIIEKTLAEELANLPEGREKILGEAMRYGVGAGGKRIRPVLALAAAEAAGGGAEDAKYAAAAIEFLHNYTLIHDDLPAMDNDTMRRGKPSVWAKFGEANAILAADALQALAFATLAKSKGDTAKLLSAFGAAGVGVVAGQIEDIARGDIDFVFAHKTADLFICAAKAGAIAAGADDACAAALGEYAFHLGMAFQYEDDLLDGDDGAFSSLSTMSTAEVEAAIARHSAAALAALDNLPGEVSFLRVLAARLAERKE